MTITIGSKLGAETSFTYDHDLTETDYKRLNRRVETFLKNTDYETTALVFSNSRHELTVTFIFDLTDTTERNAINNLRPRLQRFIDSHKLPATYSWSLASSLHN